MRETFCQFDAGTPGIGQEGDREVEFRHGPVRGIQFDSIVGEGLAEGCEILDFKADVIDGAALRLSPPSPPVSRAESRR